MLVDIFTAHGNVSIAARSSALNVVAFGYLYTPDDGVIQPNNLA
jgi:hypothetical protein